MMMATGMGPVGIGESISATKTTIGDTTMKAVEEAVMREASMAMAAKAAGMVVTVGMVVKHTRGNR